VADTKNEKLERTKGGQRKLDFTRLLDGKVESFILSLKRPAFEENVERFSRSLGLNPTEAPALRAIMRDSRKFVTLPRDVTQEFSKIANAARKSLQSFSISMPFSMGKGIVTVPAHITDELWSAMDYHYGIFQSAKASLKKRLPAIREERRAAFEKAARAIWKDKGMQVEESEFLTVFDRVFSRCFPTASDIEKKYSFRFWSYGTITKSVNLFTLQEALKTEEGKARLKLQEDAEAELHDQVLGWLGKVKVQSRVELLKALWPIAQGLASGEVVFDSGGVLAEKLRDTIKGVLAHDVFGDKTVEELSELILEATAKAESAAATAKGIATDELEDAVFIANKKVLDSLKDLKFDPKEFRLLELDDEVVEFAAVDAEAAAVIKEKSNAALRKAVKEMAESAFKTPEERKAAEAKIARQVKLDDIVSEAVAAGATPAEVEEKLDLAERFTNLDCYGDHEVGPKEAEMDESAAADIAARVGALEIDEEFCAPANDLEVEVNDTVVRAEALEI
jgi:hypothetical protein